MDLEKLLFLALVVVCGLAVLQLAIWLVARAWKALAGRVRQLAARSGSGGRNEVRIAPSFRH